MAQQLLAADIPQGVLEVVQKLQGQGFAAFLVGGCVRDLLRGEAPKDFDVATSAPPLAVQRHFKRVIPTGIDHGTVTVVLHGLHIEVTTFRAEAEYVDGRRPSKVEFHDDIEADLSRRDFTINAMAWDPASKRLVDPFSGQNDLRARIVRCVRDPLERFREDGLRPLRAVRFATVLDFSLEAQTEAAIPQTLAVFRKVAAERIHQELVKLLLSGRVAPGFALLKRTGLLGSFFPEAMESDFGALERAPAREAIRLALLLLARLDSREIVLRLRFPVRVAEEVSHLVSNQELPPSPLDDASLRRWLARVGPSHVPTVLALNQARGVDCGALASRAEAILLGHPPLAIKDLALDGQAIMKALGVGPSPIVGQAARHLLEVVLDDPRSNTNEGLVKVLEEWKIRTG